MGIFTGSKSIAARDKEIKELQAQVKRLTGKNTELVDEKAQLEGKVNAAYAALVQEKRVREAAEQEATERFATIAQLRLVMQAQTEAQEHDTEMQQNMNDASKALMKRYEAMLIFVRKVATGANIRSDKPGGKQLVADAKSLVEKDVLAREPVLVDCPYCHGAHEVGHVCPLAPKNDV